MGYLTVLCLVTLLSELTSSAPPFVAPENQLRTFTLEELIPPRKEFQPKRITGEWISGSEFVFVEPGALPKKYDANTSRIKPFFTEEQKMRISHPIASFGRDGRHIILATESQKVFRYSLTAKYSIYDLEQSTSWPLADGKWVQTFVWSSGPRQAIAYVHHNNVYYVADITNPLSVVALTTTGVPGQIYNGINDWLYEEEIFEAPEAMWFSTKGTYLAVATFNDTLVESATYPVYGNPASSDFQYPHLVKLKYPKAGRTNPAVSLNVFPLSNDWSVYKPIINIPAPSIVGAEAILGRVSWATDRHVVVLWLNRRQNTSALLKCDVETATCENVRVRNEPNGWIDVSDMHFDKSGSSMVDISPAGPADDRHYHAVLLNFADGTSRDLSPGNLTVNRIHAWNQDTNSVYFNVLPRDRPWETQLWSNTNGVVECVTCGLAHCKVAKAEFEPSGKHALVTCLSFVYVPQVFMYNAETKNFKLWESNEELYLNVAQYKLPVAVFSVATLPGGAPLHAQLMLPPDLDKSKKHPMIVKIYGGPGSTRVMDKRDLDYDTYLAGNRSIITCYIDVRGSGAMGINNMYSVNNALGVTEVNDALEAIRYLTQKHSYIDEARVGVWGWSYGGYASAMMLARDKKRTLKCAASIAPVTSWLYYDTIYTERYMGVPGSNLAGYERSDLLLQARNIRARSLLLVHGNADDNVHYQHSMMLSKVLQHADIEFEQMSYPDENHSLFGVGRHLYHTLDRYWTECFK